MAVDMNIMGTSVAPDMIRKSIRQFHQANQLNGETLARKLLNVGEDEAMPVYRIEKNQFPRLVYHPEFRSHMVADQPMDERTQARYLKKVRNEPELKEALKRGWLLDSPVAMNDLPPAESLPDESFGEESAYAMVSEMDTSAEEEKAPIRNRGGRPRKDAVPETAP